MQSAEGPNIYTDYFLPTKMVPKTHFMGLNVGISVADRISVTRSSSDKQNTRSIIS